jgi:hypothetical protein
MPSETWVLTKENERALNTWESKIMRKIYGPMNGGDSGELGQMRNSGNCTGSKIW